jgi:hypothetical protein
MMTSRSELRSRCHAKYLSAESSDRLEHPRQEAVQETNEIKKIPKKADQRIRTPWKTNILSRSWRPHLLQSFVVDEAGSILGNLKLPLLDCLAELPIDSRMLAG